MDSITAEDVYVIFVELVNKMVRKCKIMAKHQPECFLVLAKVYIAPTTLKRSGSAVRVLKKPYLHLPYSADWLKSGFFSKSLVLCLNKSIITAIMHQDGLLLSREKNIITLNFTLQIES